MKHSWITSLSCLALACASTSKTDTAAPEPATAVETHTPTAVAPIPDGFWTLTPVLTVHDVGEAMAFYAQHLGAAVVSSLPGADGTVMHANMKLGDSMLMMGPEEPGRTKSPATLGGTPVTLHVYVEDLDTMYNALLAAGAKAIMPPANMFWGDRYAEVTDPFGHRWSLATHLEDLTPEQMDARSKLAMEELAEMSAPAKKPREKALNTKEPQTPTWQTITATKATSYLPKGYHTMTLALTADNAAALIDFYKQSVGAQEMARMNDSEGKVMHAELRVGTSVLMLSDAMPAMDRKGPMALGGSPVAIYMYTDNVDTAFANVKAVSGVQPAHEPSNMFWGDRTAAFTDPSGFYWELATHVEDVTPQDMQTRMHEQMAAQG